MYESSSSVIFFALLFIIIFGARGQIRSGTECKTSDGKRGVCVLPSQCKPSFFDEPKVCEYSENSMKVCCSEKSSEKKQMKESSSTPELNSREISDRYFASGDLFVHPQIFYEKPFSVGSDPYVHRPHPSTGYEWFYSKPREPIYNVNNGYYGDYPYEEPARETEKNSFIWNNEDEEGVRPLWNPNNYKPGGTGARNRKRISEIKCEEYSRLVSQTIGALPLSLNAHAVPFTLQKCEYTPLKLIVGGEPSNPGEFPHMAAVGFQTGNNEFAWNCGGTLISDGYVLTAGHCTNTAFGDPVVVRLGEYNLVSNEDGAQPLDFAVAEVIPHPQYKKPSRYNDIALLRLSRSVVFTKRIRPACLHHGQEHVPVNRSIATGWGRTNYVGLSSDILMKVSLSIINNTLCNQFYLTTTQVTTTISRGITDDMLCAGEINGGADTCFGDSGGPLQIISPNNPCVYYVVGITSFGKVCGAPRTPGVYTRVSSFIPWIESVVW